MLELTEAWLGDLWTAREAKDSTAGGRMAVLLPWLLPRSRFERAEPRLNKLHATVLRTVPPDR